MGTNDSFPHWEKEFYWLADESIVTLQKVGLQVEYRQISGCTGVYQIQK